MSESETARRAPLFKRVLFPGLLLEKSLAQQLAYVGVVTALCIVVNTFEIKFFTVQFSLTLFMSVIAGILIGPVFGGIAVLLGDAIGYVISGMGFPYYWWVALSVMAMAVISGLVMKLKFNFRGSIYAKLALICILTFVVCSVGINTTGMYYLGLPLWMPKEVLAAAGEYFGGELDFGIYFVIRFFLLGQIYNSAVNYALVFAAVPVLKAIKPLKLDLV